MEEGGYVGGFFLGENERWEGFGKSWSVHDGLKIYGWEVGDDGCDAAFA